MHYRCLNGSQRMVKYDPKELSPSDFGLTNETINAVRVNHTTYNIIVDFISFFKDKWCMELETLNLARP